ncbi:hypothetical protein [uncultured Formosa sp.]|uniref:hypothetical protein n=1 Tax=uncultured Formosa sp. TaxID=255435 RepID=UPI00260DFACB|nr:hypothetical protein [uncultured Formosa sp.]
MKRLLTYEFGSLKLYENYVLAEMNEGVTITTKDNAILVNIAKEYYKGKPFAYISNRRHSYSVDPSVYLEASKIENLIGFAIVTNRPTALNNTKVERMFSKKTYITFEIISEAKLWANSIVKQKKKSLQKKKETSS